MLKVITGKPASGKTFHVVNNILIPMLVDWCRYEDKHNKKFKRSLYTNLPLNLEFIDEELTYRYKLFAKPSSYINIVELKGNFWESIPDNALLIFDEVHHALGAEVKGSLSVDFRNYVSTHRHKHHDIFLLTQHVENASKDILRMAEEVIELQNIKSSRVPIFNIPFSDIYAVLRSFGYSNQTYIASYGRVVGRAIKYDKKNQKFTIKKDDFGFYNTHTYGSGDGDSSDAPDLELSPLRAVSWFLGRYLWGVVFKILILAIIIFVIYNFIRGVPSVLSSLSPSSSASAPASNKKATISESAVSTSLSSGGVAVGAVSISSIIVEFKALSIIGNSAYFSDSKKYRVGDLVKSKSDKENDSKIVSINVSDGIITLENDDVYLVK